jgi:hypothetical protein
MSKIKEINRHKATSCLILRLYGNYQELYGNYTGTIFEIPQNVRNNWNNGK